MSFARPPWVYYSALYVHGDAAGAVAAITFPQSRLPARALCVLGIFRNERLNIREWVAHYRWQGASAVLLLDNGSTDAWREELAGFEDFVTVLDAPRKHAQDAQYNQLGRAWLDARGCEFAAVLDVDEFLFVSPSPAGAARSLREVVVDAFDSAGARFAQLSCAWLMFGSSGLVAHPRAPESGVRINFTWRASTQHELKKSIVRLAALRHFNVHEHTVAGETSICPEGLRLNHYAVQSREYFEHVKMARGDVASVKYEGVRDWTYFSKFDFHEELDETLKILVLRATKA